jgi:hypothetical protein
MSGCEHSGTAATRGQGFMAAIMWNLDCAEIKLKTCVQNIVTKQRLVQPLLSNTASRDPVVDFLGLAVDSEFSYRIVPKSTTCENIVHDTKGVEEGSPWRNSLSCVAIIPNR